MPSAPILPATTTRNTIPAARSTRLVAVSTAALKKYPFFFKPRRSFRPLCQGQAFYPAYAAGAGAMSEKHKKAAALPFRGSRPRPKRFHYPFLRFLSK